MQNVRGGKEGAVRRKDSAISDASNASSEPAAPIARDFAKVTGPLKVRPKAERSVTIKAGKENSGSCWKRIKVMALSKVGGKG